MTETKKTTVKKTATKKAVAKKAVHKKPVANKLEIDFSKSTYLNERDTNSQVGNLLSTPSENEDPVFYGFEVVINQMTSPLLNVQLAYNEVAALTGVRTLVSV
jgi:hypothetical protein